MDYFSFDKIFVKQSIIIDYLGIFLLKNIIIIIHFQSIIIDYFCYFVETDKENPIQSVILHESSVWVGSCNF